MPWVNSSHQTNKLHMLKHTMLLNFIMFLVHMIPEEDYRDLLTDRELTCLQQARDEYLRIYEQEPEEDPDLLIYLGDNFSNRKTWSGTSRRGLHFFQCSIGQRPLSKNNNVPAKNNDIILHTAVKNHGRRIPTFRTGGGLMWWYGKNRWMSHRERLSSMAFPVTEEMANAMGVPPVPIRDRSRAAAISGNSMNFATAAVVQLVAMVSFQKVS